MLNCLYSKIYWTCLLPVWSRKASQRCARFHQVRLLFFTGIKQKICCCIFLDSSDKSAKPAWKLRLSSRENLDSWEITALDCCFFLENNRAHRMETSGKYCLYCVSGHPWCRQILTYGFNCFKSQYRKRIFLTLWQ